MGFELMIVRRKFRAIVSQTILRIPKDDVQESRIEGSKMIPLNKKSELPVPNIEPEIPKSRIELETLVNSLKNIEVSKNIVSTILGQIEKDSKEIIDKNQLTALETEENRIQRSLTVLKVQKNDFECEIENLKNDLKALEDQAESLKKAQILINNR